MHRCREIMALLRTLLVALWLQIAYLPVSAQESQQQLLSEWACTLDGNDTLKLGFYASVRRLYGDGGNPEDDDMYSQVQKGVASNVRCYGSCKGATIRTTTWCVHVYSPGEPVEVCFNSNGVINETRAAKMLGLKDLLHVTSCDSTAGCLSVAAPYYLHNAYLVCASRTATCARRSFVELTVAVPKKDVRIVDFPAPMLMTKTGDGLVLKCDATAGYEIAYLQWIRRRDNFTYFPIYEDPLCNAEIKNCSRDEAPGVARARSSTVRMYNVFRTVGQCENVAVNMTSYLVIDNITAEDGGDYACVATNYYLTAKGLTVTQSLRLSVVFPMQYGSHENANAVLQAAANAAMENSEYTKSSRGQ
eukprot:Em0005g92a